MVKRQIRYQVMASLSLHALQLGYVVPGIGWGFSRSRVVLGLGQGGEVGWEIGLDIIYGLLLT